MVSFSTAVTYVPRVRTIAPPIHSRNSGRLPRYVGRRRSNMVGMSPARSGRRAMIAFAKGAASTSADVAPYSLTVVLRANTLLAATLHFRKTVWAYYKKYGRHDWGGGKDHDPYRILVSEVMLQQTQVERVIPFYRNFLKKFPTAKKLAAASLSDVLSVWQGLGYNRRAKLLREAAKGFSDIQFLSYRTNSVFDSSALVR